jgi:hypothetical protein
VSWLARQLRDAPGALCIEPIAAYQRGKGAAKTLAQVREDPKILVDDPKRELRAFTVSLTANVGTKRGQGKGSFVSSVVSTIDRFYAEVVQHIKPWTQAPPKIKDDEPSPADQIAAADTAATGTHDIEIGNGLPSREAALAPTLGLTESARDRRPEPRDLQIAKRSTAPLPGGRFAQFYAQRLLRRARWLPFALLVVTWDDLDDA